MRESNRDVDGSTARRICLSLGGVILVLMVVLIWITSNLSAHFLEQLNGFWVGATERGQFIVYLDRGQMRVIESTDLVGSSPVEKGSYEISSSSVWDMDVRHYRLRISGLKGRGDIGKRLARGDIGLDLYSVEGTCILHDGDGDLIVLVKDNQTGLSIMS
jgi:hypothetical protein